MKWLEITADYRCNNRCVGCFAVQADGPAMTSAEVLAELRWGRSRGATDLWLGGGDPTLRKDLFGIVRAARALGYTRVKLQTNAMLLAYEPFAARCHDAGVTEVNLSIKGATAATHDRLARTPGGFALMLEGAARMNALGITLEGDVLVYRSNLSEFVSIVRDFTARGVQRFNVWLFSASEHAGQEIDLRDEVPRLADVMPHVTAAMDLGLSSRVDLVTALHAPPCTIPVGYEACRFDVEALDLTVSNPGGHRFPLASSAMEGGVYLPTCEGCSERPHCRGIRADYLRVHGDAEFRPRSCAATAPSRRG